MQKSSAVFLNGLLNLDCLRPHLFCYFQVRHCAGTLFSDYPPVPAKRPWEDLLDLNLKQKSLVSRIYLVLMSFDEDTTSKTEVAWEQELGIKFTGGWRGGKGL